MTAFKTRKSRKSRNSRKSRKSRKSRRNQNGGGVLSTLFKPFKKPPVLSSSPPSSLPLLPEPKKKPIFSSIPNYGRKLTNSNIEWQNQQDINTLNGILKEIVDLKTEIIENNSSNLKEKLDIKINEISQINIKGLPKESVRQSHYNCIVKIANISLSSFDINEKQKFLKYCIELFNKLKQKVNENSNTQSTEEENSNPQLTEEDNSNTQSTEEDNSNTQSTEEEEAKPEEAKFKNIMTEIFNNCGFGSNLKGGRKGRKGGGKHSQSNTVRFYLGFPIAVAVATPVALCIMLLWLIASIIKLIVLDSPKAAIHKLTSR